MMGRLEKRYLFTEDILAWCHGQYTRDVLEKMNMSQLFEIHNQLYCNRIREENTIRK